MTGESAVRWNDVFSRSSLGREVFYIKDTRGRNRDSAPIDHIEDVLVRLGTPHRRGYIRGVWDEWRHAGFGFLDGGYTSVTEGAAWVFGGGYVIGFDAFRLLCFESNLAPPRRLAGETEGPRTHQQLLERLTAQLADPEQRSRLELVAESLAKVSSEDDIRRFLEGSLGAGDEPSVGQLPKATDIGRTTGQNAPRRTVSPQRGPRHQRSQEAPQASAKWRRYTLIKPNDDPDWIDKFIARLEERAKPSRNQEGTDR